MPQFSITKSFLIVKALVHYYGQALVLQLIVSKSTELSPETRCNVPGRRNVRPQQFRLRRSFGRTHPAVTCGRLRGVLVDGRVERALVFGLVPRSVAAQPRRDAAR